MLTKQVVCMFEGFGAGVGHIFWDCNRDGKHSEYNGKCQTPRHESYCQQAASNQPADAESAEAGECTSAAVGREYVSTRVLE